MKNKQTALLSQFVSQWSSCHWFSLWFCDYTKDHIQSGSNWKQFSSAPLQVKIWFQNRRAKERKLMKKKMTHFDGSSLGSLQSDSGSVSPMPVAEAQTHSEMASSLFPAPPPPAALPMSGLQHGGTLQQVVASQWRCGGATVALSPRSGSGALQHPSGTRPGAHTQGH